MGLSPVGPVEVADGVADEVAVASGGRAGKIDGVSPAPDEEDPKDPFRLKDDPGWPLRGTDGPPDGLVGLRLTFLLIVGALVAVQVVVGLLSGSVADRDDQIGGWVAAGLVVVVGVVGLLLVRFAPARLDCADELALARSWRNRFFARTSAAILPALAGLIGWVLSGVPGIYSLGLTFTAVGFALSGPFHATLVRDQEQLAEEACAIALVPALRHPVTDRTR